MQKSYQLEREADSIDKQIIRITQQRESLLPRTSKETEQTRPQANKLHALKRIQIKISYQQSSLYQDDRNNPERDPALTHPHQIPSSIPSLAILQAVKELEITGADLPHPEHDHERNNKAAKQVSGEQPPIGSDPETQ